ncbi:hypothetical protein CRG98_027659 [Punica granatum]|uniref:Uncharacterized protein n=1 Tax=Punica granatum TaxID=22663 RepID=A0A2I0J6Z9_PUNGR|nr:hypothetical protein CRG98_027659 [Punica granatum]
MWKKKTKKKLRKGLVNCGRFPSDPMGEGGGQRQRFASCWTMEEEATAQAQVQKVSSAQLSSAQPRDVFLWLWGFSFVQLSLRSVIFIFGCSVFLFSFFEVTGDSANTARFVSSVLAGWEMLLLQDLTV